MSKLVETAADLPLWPLQRKSSVVSLSIEQPSVLDEYKIGILARWSTCPSEGLTGRSMNAQIFGNKEQKLTWKKRGKEGSNI